MAESEDRALMGQTERDGEKEGKRDGQSNGHELWFMETKSSTQPQSDAANGGWSQYLYSYVCVSLCVC